MFKASDFFTLPDSLPFHEFFHPSSPPWVWVEQIQKALAQFDFAKHPRKCLIPQGFTVGDQVYLDPSVKLPPYGVIEGPAYIGPRTELRPGVYIRQNVIVGEACVLGNACEYKNCLLMDAVMTPHYNYVGDSILGSKSHMAAGSILANLRLDKALISIKIQEQLIPTGLRKLGTIIGEGAEIGCNAVLQPGTLLGKNAVVMPTVAFGGYLAPETRAK